MPGVIAIHQDLETQGKLCIFADSVGALEIVVGS
jgi:hypothetical protein